MVSCTSLSNKFEPYNCFQFEGEPKWVQIHLEEERENKLQRLVDEYYSKVPNDDPNYFLLNTDRKRKYFWYQAETGDVLACVIDENLYKQANSSKDGCFADRIIIKTKNQSINLQIAESIWCT